jgi:hypothetical protein
MDQWREAQLEYFEENSIDRMEDISQFRYRRRIIEKFLNIAV